MLAGLLATTALHAGPEGTLRVMTYNIHHGAGTDGVLDLGRIADVINGQDPDLVAVQEVDVKTGRTGQVDQAETIAKLTEMHHVFGKFMDYSGGEYGQMVLSKFPIRSSENHVLPPGPEPRTALEVRVGVPLVGGGEQEIVFVGNHLYRTGEERLAQAETIAKIYQDETVPIILAGDFNSEPPEAPMALLGKRWKDPTLDTDAPTWPAGEPEVEIDYVLYTPEERFEPVSSEVVDEKVASDHRPVLTVLRLKPSPRAPGTSQDPRPQ